MRSLGLQGVVRAKACAAGDTPTSTAASSLVSPRATAIQNVCMCSPRHTVGLPGEYIGGRPVCSCTHVVVTDGDSYRFAQARDGKGVTPLA